MRQIINILTEAAPMQRVKVKGRAVFVDDKLVGEMQGWRNPAGYDHSKYFLKLVNKRDLFARPDQHGNWQGSYAYARDLKIEIIRNPDGLLAAAALPEAPRTDETAIETETAYDAARS